jgi:UDP-N-acetylglucosamine--N-acetylmuramyl-(pentapeptide) pyrophosphoryl-undecaprenol N-acetylglucosamine transferase
VKVVFAGGGTGGHLYPAIAIADALRERGAAIDFIGTADRLEATIVPQAGYPLHTVASRPLTRKLSPELARTIGDNLAGTRASLRLLRDLHPEIIVATGGYVCFPVVFAARLLRTVGAIRPALALLEPNVTPGLTNRLVAPMVDEIWGAFGAAQSRFGAKYQTTGIPVRASLRELPTREAARARLGLRSDVSTLLAIGGSQGARSINDAVLALIKAGDLPAGWQVLHVTGERDYALVADIVNKNASAWPDADRVVVRPYLHDMADAYAAADLVLARAGASTLGELIATGRPAVLVPYPHAAEDHQTANARHIEETGAAVVVTDGELKTGRLLKLLPEIMAAERLRTMRDAARTLRYADPLATILARVDALTARKNKA